MSKLADADEMTMNERETSSSSARSARSVGATARRDGPSFLIIAALVIAVIVAIALWRMGSNLGQQACVQRTLAEYPGISVSAYDSPRQTGALKLSYDNERRQALKKC